MNITLFYDIINVWYSDAHRICVFFVVFTLPLFIIFFRYYARFLADKAKFSPKVNFSAVFFLFFTELLFALLVISYILGLVGFGQLILPWTIDVIVRSAGLAILSFGLVTFITFSKMHPNLYEFDHDNRGFYNYIRHPYYSLQLCVAFGMALSTVSIIAMIIFVIMFAITIFSLRYIEKQLCIKDEFFIDYKYTASTLVPNFLTVLKILFKL